jgi:predicted TIM-barrel fold metal-dependent hydrolase
VLEPALPICDPHHHLWDFEAHRYLLPDLLADVTSGHDVRSTVFIECTSMYRPDGPPELRPLGETEFVNGAAAMSASGRYGPVRACAGIVGFADLALGARVEAVLEAHLALSGGRFRGIRHISACDASPAIRRSHTNPPPHLLGDARFREGFARLRGLGLSFDAWLYHPQIGELTELARAFPEQPIVLDHVGGPLGIGPYEGKRAEIFPQWRKAIVELATCPNVHVKLGGIGMKINGFGFHKRPRPPGSEELAQTWRPYMETCIEAFTPRRCMFESNFPVDKVSGSYRVYWNAFKRLAAGASAAEKAALFHDTAAAFYRLG